MRTHKGIIGIDADAREKVTEIEMYNEIQDAKDKGKKMHDPEHPMFKMLGR